jgi:CAAX amino terminal protease family.
MFYLVEYNITDIVLGLFSGFAVFIINTYISKKENRIIIFDNSKPSTISKKPILAIMKVFPDKVGFFMIIIFIASIVIFEELIFRKYLLGYLILTLKFDAVWVITLVSLFFALSHFNIKKIIQLFLLGLTFSGLVVYTNNLLPAIIAHFFNNLIIAFYYKYNTK